MDMLQDNFHCILHEGFYLGFFFAITSVTSFAILAEENTGFIQSIGPR